MKKPFLAVYPENPRYFAFDNQPLFLCGATSTWTPISSPNCDFVAENQALIDNGGNFTRALMFFPNLNILTPWGRASTEKTAADGELLFDLTTWNEKYWERFRAYLQDCEDKGIFVCLEIFDEPSIRYNFGPKQRWAVHPFNPTNNINLTIEDNLPAGVYDSTLRHFYDAARLQSMGRVLDLQKKFVSELLRQSAPWSGRIIYSICNEYTYNEGNHDSSDKTHAFAFPKFWADFIHQWAKENNTELLVAMMPGRSPDKDCYFEDDEFRKYFEDPTFDAIDMAENPTPADAWVNTFAAIAKMEGKDLAMILKRYYGRWTAFQYAIAKIKPLFNSKILYHCVTRSKPPAPEPVWALFFLGAAVSRCHRPQLTAPETNITGQLDIIRKLRNFVDKVPFYQMYPRHELVGANAMCLAEAGESYAVFIPAGGATEVYLSEEIFFESTWYDVHAGEFISGPEIIGKAGGVKLISPFEGAAAIIIKRKGA